MSGVWGADIIVLKSTDDSDVYTFFRYTPSCRNKLSVPTKV